MKLLTEAIDVNEVNRLRILFDSNGIPIFIANEDAARNFGLIYPARQYAVHVVYDEQYEDALMLLQDENHVVENQIAIEDYKKYLEDNKLATLSLLLKKTLLIGAAFSVFAIVFIWVFVTKLK